MDCGRMARVPWDRSGVSCWGVPGSKVRKTRWSYFLKGLPRE